MHFSTDHCRLEIQNGGACCLLLELTLPGSHVNTVFDWTFLLLCWSAAKLLLCVSLSIDSCHTTLLANIGQQLAATMMYALAVTRAHGPLASTGASCT